MNIKTRCCARTQKNKTIWGSVFSKYCFGVQCSRKAQDNKKFCKTHEGNLPYGTYLNISKPDNIVIDIDDTIYEFLRKHNLSPPDFENSGQSIIQYLLQFLRSNGVPIPSYLSSYDLEHQQLILEKLKQTEVETIHLEDFQKVYHTLIQNIIFQPKIIDYIVKNSVETFAIEKIKREFTTLEETKTEGSTHHIPKQLSEKYLQLKKWWETRDKIKITDYDTKQEGTFAIEYTDGGSYKLYTQAKVLVGTCESWKDDNIPDKFKNDSKIILSPKGSYYLPHIKLFHDTRKLHNLPKEEYYEYKYITKFNILQKTYELEYI